MASPERPGVKVNKEREGIALLTAERGESKDMTDSDLIPVSQEVYDKLNPADKKDFCVRADMSREEAERIVRAAAGRRPDFPSGKDFVDEVRHHKQVSGSQKETEADFQRALIDLLHVYGYKVCEFRKARVKKDGVDTYRTPFGADGVGHPDLLVAHPESGNSFYVECKSDKGTLSREQKDWLDWLRKCGHTCFVWRPKDWDYLTEVIKILCVIS